jgi:hypothetical protein
MYDGNWNIEATTSGGYVCFSSKNRCLDTYYFPSEIAEEIGFSPNYINNLKRWGCHFHGRKTTIRHVRDFLARKVEELV